MRIILLAIAALIILGGAGVGAYFYFGKAQAADGGEVGHNAEKAELETQHHQYVELDPLILPIIDGNGVNQVVSMVISIEVSDEKTKAMVENLSPRLKDAFIMDMYGILNRQAALKGGVIQVSDIKARLHKIGAKVLGENVIQDVLLQVVQQRPI